MCHQTVSLVQAEIERHGITTASITMMPEITRAVAPPRALNVPYDLGFPLGLPNEPLLHRKILESLLKLCQNDVGPTITDFAE